MSAQTLPEQQQPSGRRLLVWILVPLLLLAGLIGWRLHVNKVNAQALQSAGGGRGARGPAAVGVALVSTRDLIHTFSTTANIESPQTVKVSPRVAEQIISITVQEGDPVRRGEVLARLDDAQLSAAVQKAQATLASSRAKLLQAQATQNSTLTPLQTQIRQNQASVRSAQANYQQVRASYAQQVAAAQAAVADAQGRVASAQAQRAVEHPL